MFRKGLFLFFGICLWVGGSIPVWGQAASFYQAEWSTFVSQEGRFSVRFPGNPHVKSEPFPVLGKESTIHRYTVEVPREYIFEVAFCDNPPGIAPFKPIDGPRKFFSWYGASKGEREVLTNVLTGLDCHGVETFFNHSGAGWSRVRVWSSGYRQYYLIFANLRQGRCLGNNQDSYIEDFFASFQIEGGCSTEIEPTVPTYKESSTISIKGISDPQTGWELVNSEAGRFSILMPGGIAWKETEAHPNFNTLQIYSYQSSNESGNYTVMAVHGLDPRPINYPTEIQQLLLAGLGLALKEGAESNGASMTLTTTFEGEGFVGENYDVMLQGGLARIRLILTPETLYILTVSQTGKRARAVSDKQFFDSFQLAFQEN